MARASPTIRRAQASTRSPSGVKLRKREPRLTSSTPMASSSCLTPADSVGWVTPQASAAHLAALAQEMKLAETEVYEVATFYAHFDVVKEDETPPPALTVRVCDSLSCAMAGAEHLLRTLPNRLGTDVRVVPAPCMGACDRAPVCAVGHVQVMGATTENVAAAGAQGTHAPAHPNPNHFQRHGRARGY